ncbi:MAG: right-handed parallel beta-helix repeat-containing protein [Limisphaerales bacterium]
MLKRMIATASHSHGKARLFFLAMLLLAASVLPITATDYFVRQSGNDEAEGTSSNAAWRTVERVNRARFRPGDRVSFQSAQTFAGNLLLSAQDAGTSKAPVVIGSFGEGRATILAGNHSGITVENAGGIAIENLVVAGAGRTNNAGCGVLCENTLTNGERLDFLRLDNVEARDFGNLGILVAGTHAGFEHVLITNCVMHDNLRGGMEVAGRLPWDTTVYAHADVRVSHCQVFDNTGDPAYFKNHSGSGVVLYQIDGGLMDYCTAWNNGGLCPSSGGGVGLWTCASRRVTIEHCESFGNKTSGGDGGGFDIDGGSVDCVLQYNYSHDNDGPGLMVYTYPYSSFTDRGSVVRFNISENDSRKGRRYAGLWVRSDGKEISGVEIYNNTVVVGPWTDQAALINARGIEARLCNNIFIGTGIALPLRVDQPQNRVRFENNLYWRTDGPTEIAWGQQTYASLPEWREKTGEELVDGQPKGLFADPGLSRHPAGFHPGQCVGLHAVRAFHPLAKSPALADGLDLRKMFGLDPGGQDLLGPLPPSGNLPLGAIATPALE